MAGKFTEENLYGLLEHRIAIDKHLPEILRIVEIFRSGGGNWKNRDRLAELLYESNERTAALGQMWQSKFAKYPCKSDGGFFLAQAAKSAKLKKHPPHTAILSPETWKLFVQHIESRPDEKIIITDTTITHTNGLVIERMIAGAANYYDKKGVNFGNIPRAGGLKDKNIAKKKKAK